jgi:hypothetical protein
MTNEARSDNLKVKVAPRWSLVWAVVALACSQISFLGPATARAQAYGNPYPIDPQAVGDKIAEFDALRHPAIDWDSSSVAALDRALFIDSIVDNRASGMPDSDKYQRYNYVILNGKILVAIWTSNQAMSQICKQAPQPAPAAAYLASKVPARRMVNFFPEDTRLPFPLKAGGPPQPACQSAAASGKTVGVFDAHSKHFMLAQGPATRLGDYIALTSGPKWRMASVDYAGEIIVDVRNCYYVINQGSGTYRPKGGVSADFAYLMAAAEAFATTIGTAPAAVWDVSAPLVPPIKFSAKRNVALTCR